MPMRSLGQASAAVQYGLRYESSSTFLISVPEGERRTSKPQSSDGCGSSEFETGQSLPPMPPSVPHLTGVRGYSSWLRPIPHYRTQAYSSAFGERPIPRRAHRLKAERPGRLTRRCSGLASLAAELHSLGRSGTGSVAFPATQEVRSRYNVG